MPRSVAPTHIVWSTFGETTEHYEEHLKELRAIMEAVA